MVATRALLLNPPMPPSFWSLPQACRLGRVKALAPPLSLLTVAALLPRDWELRFVDVNARPLTQADWEWAELVLISGMLVQRLELLALVREAKARGKTVVVGGPYPTTLPEEVLAEKPDFLVLGEGETALPLLLQALALKEPGCVIESPQRPDLAASPMPRYDLVPLQDYLVLTLQTSRGCPHDCEFCDVVSLYGRKNRYKKPEQVIAELNAIYDLGWRQEIFFCDDNFIGNKSRAKDILARLIPWQQERGLPFRFWTQASVDLGQDPELMALLVAANFTTLVIGIETPDTQVLTRIGKKHNVKDPLVESLNNLRDHGLKVLGTFIIGFDGEAPGVGQRICDLVEATALPVVMPNLLDALPRTRLWRRLRDEGRLQVGRVVAGALAAMGGGLTFVPDRDEAEIIREYLGVWDRLYEPSRFLARTYQYFLKMRPAPPGQEPGIPPPRVLLRDILIYLELSFRSGLLSSHRAQYWRQFLGLLKANPTRVPNYIETLVLGQDMFHLRGLLHQNLDRLRHPAA